MNNTYENEMIFLNYAFHYFTGTAVKEEFPQYMQRMESEANNTSCESQISSTDKTLNPAHHSAFSLTGLITSSFSISFIILDFFFSYVRT